MKDLFPDQERAVSGVNYQVHLVSGKTYPEWDDFVARTSGGHHCQTSLWGQVKATGGWDAILIVLTDEERVIAGAQLLMHPLMLGIKVGYVTRGPLCPSDDPSLVDLVIHELLRICKAHHLTYLVIQPPTNGILIERELARHGFSSCWFELAPTATVLIDLSLDSKEILARMKRQTSQNIRRGENRGIKVRTGQESDLPSFYRLYAATNERYGTRPYSERYFKNLWNLMEPQGFIKLFLASHDSEQVSALLTITLGETVIASKLGWSGNYGDCRPNEVLFWEAIKWAKVNGYRFFDFEGIDIEGAKAVLEGKPLPEALQETPTRFKLSFGGDVVLNPGPCDYLYNRQLRWLNNKVKLLLAAWPQAHQLLLSYVQGM
jgi:lipid II:glycine glycyltransferase (peptidoglycan interpeptide bridge formation enzyme)